MRDYPLGVGWNNAIKVYEESYRPPEGGPGAIVTNDYLTIGAELGIPALLCLGAYLMLCYRNSPRAMSETTRQEGTALRLRVQTSGQNLDLLRATCLSAVLVLIVVFWFDGGLFELPAAALFWVLLELAGISRDTRQAPCAAEDAIRPGPPLK
jgi:O-antigen ligase